MTLPRSKSFWIFQGLGWLLVFYLMYAQVISAFDYELGVSMGTQESASLITEVGVAFWKGFAFADLLYTPLLAIGLFGQLKTPVRAKLLLAAALGITVYWPLVSLAAVHTARGANGWYLQGEITYWIVLPLIAVWGLWGLWRLQIEAS
ncbi:MAG: hypothetical protein ACR2QW_07400 [bacterium]